MHIRGHRQYYNTTTCAGAFDKIPICVCVVAYPHATKPRAWPRGVHELGKAIRAPLRRPALPGGLSGRMGAPHMAMGKRATMALRRTSGARNRAYGPGQRIPNGHQSRRYQWHTRDLGERYGGLAWQLVRGPIENVVMVPIQATYVWRYNATAMRATRLSARKLLIPKQSGAVAKLEGR